MQIIDGKEISKFVPDSKIEDMEIVEMHAKNGVLCITLK